MSTCVAICVHSSDPAGKQIEATMNVIHVINLFAADDAVVHPTGRRVVYHVLVKVGGVSSKQNMHIVAILLVREER